jgi:hypothetical protein
MLRLFHSIQDEEEQSNHLLYFVLKDKLNNKAAVLVRSWADAFAGLG